MYDKKIYIYNLKTTKPLMTKFLQRGHTHHEWDLLKRPSILCAVECL